MKKLNQLGMTLAEILVMMGISSVFVLALTDLVRNMMVADHTQTVNFETTQLDDEIYSMLTNQDACTTALGGQTVPAALQVPVAANLSKLNITSTMPVAGASPVPLTIGKYNDLTLYAPITMTMTALPLLVQGVQQGTYQLNVAVNKGIAGQANILGTKLYTKTYSFYANLDPATVNTTIKTCKSSDEYRNCTTIFNQFGATWDPVTKTCKFPVMTQVDCQNIGGIWDPPTSTCKLTMQSSVFCTSLPQATWDPVANLCTITDKSLPETGQTLCNKLCGGPACWVVDATKPGGFKCDFTLSFTGACAANVNLVTNIASGKCQFQPATSDACAAIGGIWLLNPYPHCELNMNPATGCTQIGCSWANNSCTCGAPPPVGNCTVTGSGFVGSPMSFSGTINLASTNPAPVCTGNAGYSCSSTPLAVAGPLTNWQFSCYAGGVCASAADPFSYQSYNACSNGAACCNSEIAPFTTAFHGTNLPGSNVTFDLKIAWHGTTSTCSYNSVLGASSTGAVSGSCFPPIPGVSAGSVDFFNTNPGCGSTAGLNILGPGPSYVACGPPPSTGVYVDRNDLSVYNVTFPSTVCGPTINMICPSGGVYAGQACIGGFPMTCIGASGWPMDCRGTTATVADTAKCGPAAGVPSTTEPAAASRCVAPAIAGPETYSNGGCSGSNGTSNSDGLIDMGVGQNWVWSCYIPYGWASVQCTAPHN